MGKVGACKLNINVIRHCICMIELFLYQSIKVKFSHLGSKSKFDLAKIIQTESFRLYKLYNNNPVLTKTTVISLFTVIYSKDP